MDIRTPDQQEVLSFIEKVLPSLHINGIDGVLSFLKSRISEFQYLGCYEGEMKSIMVYEEEKVHIVLLLSAERNLGYGSNLLQAFIERCERMHLARISANAEASAVGFYEKAGFEKTGEQQEAGGLTFVPMEYLLGQKYLNQTVTVEVDHPHGSFHPHIPDLRYPLNKGYVYLDGEIIDAYVYGVDEPVDSFTGMVCAIIYRKDSQSMQLVVSRFGMVIRKEEVISAIGVEEQYYDTRIQWGNYA